MSGRDSNEGSINGFRLLALLYLGIFDIIPGVGLLEAGIRQACGDHAGAQQCLNAQQNMATLVTKASLSTVMHVEYTEEEKKVFEGVVDMVAATPVVGLGLAAVAAAAGDNETAEKWAKSSFKSTVVVAAGAATVATGGAAGIVLAAGAGVVGGLATDGLLTGIDSAVAGEYKPYGSIDNVGKIHQAVQNGQGGQATELIIGQVLSTAGDAMGGVGGRGVGRAAKVEYQKHHAVKQSMKKPDGITPTTPISQKRVKQNLNDTIKNVKQHKDVMNQANKKHGTNTVYSEMEGVGGTKGSRLSAKADTHHLREQLSNVARDIRQVTSELAAIPQANRQGPAYQALRNRKIALENTSNQLKTQINNIAEANNALSNNQPVNHRSDKKCGEHGAAQPIYEANDVPGTCSSVRVDPKGRVTGVERCEPKGVKGGCQDYNLGACPTDFLHEVKLNPGRGKIAFIAGPSAIGGIMGIIHNDES